MRELEEGHRNRDEPSAGRPATESSAATGMISASYGSRRSVASRRCAHLELSRRSPRQSPLDSLVSSRTDDLAHVNAEPIGTSAAAVRKVESTVTRRENGALRIERRRLSRNSGRHRSAGRGGSEICTKGASGRTTLCGGEARSAASAARMLNSVRGGPRTTREWETRLRHAAARPPLVQTLGTSPRPFGIGQRLTVPSRVGSAPADSSIRRGSETVEIAAEVPLRAPASRPAIGRRRANDAYCAHSRTGVNRRRPPVAAPAVRGGNVSVAIESLPVRPDRGSGRQPTNTGSPRVSVEAWIASHGRYSPHVSPGRNWTVTTNSQNVTILSLTGS